jgi:hypothetical protein
MEGFHMKLKIDEETGSVVVSEEGLPVWILDDKTEVAYDIPKVIKDLQAANNESAGRRKKIEELEAKYRVYEGIDPEKARKAMETVQNLEDKKLLDVGEVEKVKQATGEAYELRLKEMQLDLTGKIEEKDQIIAKKHNQINDLLIKGAFHASKFIKEKTNLPAEMAYSHFGRCFRVEEVNGVLKTVASWPEGGDVFSDINPGQLASPEEAIEKLINKYPNKDSILKGAGSSGYGASPPGGKSADQPQNVLDSFYPSMKK